MGTSNKKNQSKTSLHVSDGGAQQLIETLQRELLAATEQLEAVQKELTDCKRHKERTTRASSVGKQAQSAREKAIQAIAEVVEHNVNFAAIIDMDGHALYLNRILKKTAGLSRRKSISSVNVFTWYSNEERARIEGTLVPHIVEHGFWHGETELVFAKCTIPIFQQCTLHRAGDGGAEYILMVMRDISTERELAQIRKAEERWRYAFEGNDDGVWDWNVQTNEVFYSRRWKEMLGYKEDEVGSALEEWSSRVHPDDIELAIQKLQAYVEGEKDSYRHEYRLRHRSGVYKWILDRGKLVERMPDGRPLRMVGTYTDITKQKKVEGQLRHSEERLRAMSEAVPVGIYLGGADGQAAYVNRVCEEICGVPPGEGLGLGWSRNLHPDDKERVFTAWIDATKTGTVFDSEHRFLHEDGRVVYVRAQAKVMKDSEEILGHIGIIEDITKRKATENALRESERRLRAILEAEPECVKVVGRKGELLSMNPAGLAMIEADSLEQVVGDLIPSFLRPQYRKAFIALNERVFAGETAMLEFEIQGLKGGCRWAETHASPLRDENGNVSAHIAVTRDITAKRRAQEQLRQSEARFRTISEASPLGLFVHTPDGACVYTNRVYTQLSGLTAEEARGDGWLQAVHPDDKEGLLQAVLELTHTHVLLTEEVRFLRPDNTVVWVYIKADAMWDGSQLLGYVGAVEDITARKEAEEKLRKMEERWQFAVEGSGDGAWDWDMETDTVFFSDRWKEMLGYEPHEIGDSKDEWASRVHPDDLEWVLAVLHRYLQGRSDGYKIEHRVRCKDGSYKWILARGKVIERDANGAPLRVVGTHSDVTERKLVEESMHRSEERFRAMSDASPLGIFVTDAQGYCEYTNRVYHLLSGLTLEESLGTGWSNAIHPEDRTRVFGEWFHAASQNLPFQSEHRFLRPDGMVIWTQVKTEAMKNGVEILGYIGVVEDITARKKAEQELRDTLMLQKAILDGAQHFIISANPDGSIRMANATAEKMFGYSQEEFLNIPSDTLHVEEEIEARAKKLTEELRRPIKRGRDVFLLKAEIDGKDEIEWTYIRKDGTRFIARVFVSALRDPSGVLTGFLAMGLDITERKATEQVIQRQNQMLDGILTSMPVIAYRVDENEQFTEVRGSALRRFGVTEEQLLGRRATELFPHIADVFPNAYSGEVAIAECHGTYNHIPWAFDNYLFADHHQPGHLIGLAFDSTDRRVAEEEVQRSQANLSAVFHSTTDAIWAVDMDYKLIAYNASFARYVLVTEGVKIATGMHITDMLSGDRLQRWNSLYDRVLSGEEFTDSLDAVVQEERRYFEISFSPIRYNDHVTGAVMFSKNVTEHKIAEKLLVEKLAMLNAVLESTDNIIYAVSTDYKYLAFNPMYRNMVQAAYGVDVHVGQSVFDVLMISPDGEKTMLQLERAMREGSFIVVEELGEQESEKIYYELLFYPIRTDVGSVIGAAVYMQDITERKRNEEELRRTTALQTAILQGADVSIISTDTNGIIQTFNHAAERLLGYDAVEVVCKETPAIIHDIEEVVQRSQDLSQELGIVVEPSFETFVIKARTERVDENEWIYIRKDGSKFPVLLSVTALRDKDDHITGFLGIGVDITERKRSEALLLKAQAALIEAQRIAKTGSYEIDLLTNTREWTGQAAAIFGFAEETPMDDVDLLSFVHPNDIEVVMQKWKRTLDNGTVFHCDYRIIRGDGTLVYINGFGKPVFDQNGTMVAILGTVQDISERKKYEQELIAARDEANSANRAKSEFLANMSHEIRTPMNSVLGFAELLQNLISDSKERTYINAILNSGKILLMLINDILDLSKVESGRLEFSYRLEDISAIVQEMHQIFSVRIQEKDIKMLVESNVHERFVVDPTRLRQVLLNLVGNAVKFTDTGSVKVVANEKHVEGKGRALRIVIEDTGIGIPHDQQELIFEAFRQQDGQSTRRYGGTGLGLSITKRLVEAMNGTITVHSEVGKGSTFEVLLPEATLSVHSGAKGAGNGSVLSVIEEKGILDFGQATIIVADDIESNRTLVREMLSANNVHIIECGNGRETVEAAQRYQPDMILMDLRMPDMNGHEAVEQIRAIDRIEKTPIVFLTASAMQEETFVRSLGGEAFLYKPISQKDLLKVLSTILPYTVVASGGEPIQANIPQEKMDINFFDTEEYSEDSIRVLPALIETLNTEFMPVWAELHDAPIMDEVETFARRLKEVGLASGISTVSRYSEILLNQVELVDVLAFPTTLTMFTDLVHALEQIYNNNSTSEKSE